jgi:hypothetical protein
MRRGKGNENTRVGADVPQPIRLCARDARKAALEFFADPAFLNGKKKT